MRTFIALPCPPAATAGLDEVLAQLPGRDWRPVPAEQRHITVRFLGEQPEGLALRLRETLGPAVRGLAGFPLEFAGLGAFPGAGRPDVLWAGCSGPGVPALQVLSGVIESGLAQLGVPPDPRAFRPHLTVARRRPAADRREAARCVQTLCARYGARVWGAAAAAEVVVFRSDLGQGGARHTPLVRMALAPPDSGGLP